MPLPLSLEEQNLLLTLAAPIDRNRQPEFLSAVTTRLEAQGPAACGPGALHRTAREILGGFWEPAAGSSSESGRPSRAAQLAPVWHRIGTQILKTGRNWEELAATTVSLTGGKYSLFGTTRD